MSCVFYHCQTTVSIFSLWVNRQRACCDLTLIGASTCKFRRIKASLAVHYVLFYNHIFSVHEEVNTRFTNFTTSAEMKLSWGGDDRQDLDLYLINGPFISFHIAVLLLTQGHGDIERVSSCRTSKQKKTSCTVKNISGSVWFIKKCIFLSWLLSLKLH